MLVAGKSAGGAAATSVPFIMNVTGGNCNLTYVADTSPTDKVVSAVESDSLTLQVYVEVDAGPGGWQPTVDVNGESVTLTWIGSDNEGRRFSGNVEVVMEGTGTITVTCADGGTYSIPYTLLVGPAITSAIFDTHPDTTGGDAKCPYDQTQVAYEFVPSGPAQTVRITGEMESGATQIYIKNTGISSSLQGPFNVSGTTFDIEVDVGTNSSATQTATLYAKDGDGAQGDDYETDNTIYQEQTAPALCATVVDNFPVGQEALKQSETADVTSTHSNIETGDTYAYSSNGTGELSIPADTTYAATKTVTRIAGGYRESGDNYKLTVQRAALNGRSAIKYAMVRIAHDYPVVTVTGATARLGTDDGTDNYKDHTITIQSNQRVMNDDSQKSSIDAPKGTFQGAGWTKSGYYDYVRDLRVADADMVGGGQAANDYSWANVSVKNKALRETTTITTGPDYSLGGFEERQLTIPAWPNREADIGVLVVDTSELGCENLSKGGAGPNGGTIFAFDNSPGQGSTPDDETDKFCISDGGDLVDDDNKYWYNKDYANAESNTSGTAQVLVKEDP